MRRFQWTPEREQALVLSFQGRYTQGEIAQRLGVTRRTIEGWARRSAWKAKRQEMVTAMFAESEAQMRAKWAADRAKREAEYASYVPLPRGARAHQRYRGW